MILHTFRATPDDPDLADRVLMTTPDAVMTKISSVSETARDSMTTASRSSTMVRTPCVAPAVPAEVVELGPLPEADIGDGEECVLVINEGDRADRIILDPEPHADDPGRVPSYHPDGLLMEP